MCVQYIDRPEWKEFKDFKKVNCDIARLKTTELLEYYNGFENIYPCWYINIKEKLKRNTDENTGKFQGNFNNR